MNNLKKRLGEEEFAELDKLIKREIDIRNLAGKHVDVQLKAITMLIEWIDKVYQLDEKQHADLSDTGFTLEGMFTTN